MIATVPINLVNNFLYSVLVVLHIPKNGTNKFVCFRSECIVNVDESLKMLFV